MINLLTSNSYSTKNISSEPYNSTRLISQNRNLTRKSDKPDPRNTALHKAATEFEAMFIKQMLNAMKKTTLKSGLMGANSAQNIFEDLLYDEYSKTMAATGNFGIAKSLYDQLSGRI